MKINNALNQLKRMKNSRSPGIDGMIIEHLSRVFLGGDKDEKCHRTWGQFWNLPTVFLRRSDESGEK